MSTRGQSDISGGELTEFSRDERLQADANAYQISEAS